MRILPILSVLTAVLLTGCFGDKDTEISRTPLAANTPNAFLTFPNSQASLAAGTYEVVVGTDVPGESGSYRLHVTQDDGSTQTINGSWSSSGGPSATALGNSRHEVVLTRAGGLRLTLDSSVNAYLFLVRNGYVVDSDTSSGVSGAPLINRPLSQISAAAYGEAYYAAVDPMDERLTLDAWKLKNGFNAGNDAHVIFRDAFDLGYGRDMYARRGSDGRIAVFVNNYVVRVLPGRPTNYGPLNVEAAIAQDSRYLQGTNAIEFSPADEDAPNENGSMMITKFFTFDAGGKRIASADLDGRGVKHMPGMCWACHGGQPMPLDTNGKFQAASLRSAKMNLLDVGLLEYSPQADYQRSRLEAGLKLINQYVGESYDVMAARDVNDADTGAAHWSASFAQSLVVGRYVASSTHIDTFIPTGWQASLSRPEGVESLYKQVVEPHCIGCHSVQGSTAAEDAAALANAINFSSYEKFISYREKILDYVYRRGIMPMSLRNFERFWKTPDAAPTLLASYLSEPALYDAAGAIIQPGRPVARLGANRSVRPSAAGNIQLDGNSSLYAGTYQWRVVSAPGVATLSSTTNVRPVLNVTSNGNHVIELTVSNTLGSHSSQMTLMVNGALAKTPDQLTFVDDIMPILGSSDNSVCSSCHNSGGGYPGIPVYWSNDAGLYRRVLERVDVREPENSKLLVKPTSLNHGGGIQLNLLVPADKAKYDTLLSWISAGAVCGTNPALCP
jgi:hypothetical protein